jgi:hypothetical protein
VPEINFTNLLIVVGAAFGAPLAPGFLPRLRVILPATGLALLRRGGGSPAAAAVPSTATTLVMAEDRATLNR